MKETSHRVSWAHMACFDAVSVMWLSGCGLKPLHAPLRCRFLTAGGIILK